jgi:hypothetical protein
MARNRSDLVLDKVAEDEKCAPNWARLHLKWREACGMPADATARRSGFRSHRHHACAQLPLTHLPQRSNLYNSQ